MAQHFPFVRTDVTCRQWFGMLAINIVLQVFSPMYYTPSVLATTTSGFHQANSNYNSEQPPHWQLMSGRDVGRTEPSCAFKKENLETKE